MSVSNATLAQQVSEATIEWQTYATDLRTWLASTDDTATFTNPATLETTIVKTLHKIEQDYQAAIDPVTGAASQALQWAVHPVDSLVPAGNGVDEYSSRHYAAKAAESAALAAAGDAAADEAIAARNQALIYRDDAETAKDQAQTARAGAETARTGAETAETNAAQSVTDAAAQVALAATEASDAATSATAAVNAKNDAEAAETGAQAAELKASQWADTAEDQAVEPGRFSAFHWAKKAEAAAGVDLSSYANLANDNVFTGRIDVTDLYIVDPGISGFNVFDSSSGYLTFRFGNPGGVVPTSLQIGHFSNGAPFVSGYNGPFLVTAHEAALSLRTLGADPLTFDTSGTERMRIEPGGDVGIGTTNPTAPLEVSYNDANDFSAGMVLRKDNGNSNAWTRMNFLNGSSLTGLVYSDSVAFSLRSDIRDVQMYTQGAHNLRFVTQGADRMIVTADGDVGVGTETPEARLHVIENGGKVRFGRNATQFYEFDLGATMRIDSISTPGNAKPLFHRCRLDVPAAVTAGYVGHQFTVDTPAAADRAAYYIFGPSSAEQNRLDHIWYGPDNVEAMRIDGDNMRLGVGTNAPAATLHVGGGAKFDGAVDLDAGLDNWGALNAPLEILVIGSVGITDITFGTPVVYDHAIIGPSTNRGGEDVRLSRTGNYRITLTLELSTSSGTESTNTLLLYRNGVVEDAMLTKVLSGDRRIVALDTILSLQAFDRLDFAFEVDSISGGGFLTMDSRSRLLIQRIS